MRKFTRWMSAKVIDNNCQSINDLKVRSQYGRFTELLLLPAGPLIPSAKPNVVFVE